MAEEDAVQEGPTDEEQQRIDGAKGLYWRTCDQCAQQGICLVDGGECYICEECLGFHERALDAAHEALRVTGLVPSLRDHQIDTLAWAAVKAYIEFADDNAESDGAVHAATGFVQPRALGAESDVSAETVPET